MARRRRWFQFSLRGFLVVMTGLGIWLGVIANRAREQRAAVVAIKELGGTVYYDWELETGGTPRGPAWLRRLVGDEHFQKVQMVNLCPAPTLGQSDIGRLAQHLRRLPRPYSIVVPPTMPKTTLIALNEAIPDSEVSGDEEH
jgi:hypothetical protein